MSTFRRQLSSSIDLIKLSSTHSSKFAKCKTQNDLVDLMVSLGVLTSENVIDSFRRVDRALFIPEKTSGYAEPYHDKPITIAYSGATMSTPIHHASIVENIWKNFSVNQGQRQIRVVDVGSGSGYLSILLATLYSKAYPFISIESTGYEAIPELAIFSNTVVDNHFQISNSQVKFLVAGNISDITSISYSADIVHISFSIKDHEFRELAESTKTGALLLAPVIQSQKVEQMLTMSIDSHRIEIEPVLCQPKLITTPDKPLTLAEVKDKLDSWVINFELERGKKPSTSDILQNNEAKQLFHEFKRLRQKIWE